MVYSTIVALSPVEEAFHEMATKFQKSKDIMKPIEKMFMKYSKKKEINNEEFENTELQKYYELTLQMPPEFVGFRWICNISRPMMENKYVNALCKSRICRENYNTVGRLNSTQGVLETNLGQIEELHIKLWIERLHFKFCYDEAKVGVKKMDFDRVVRDYYETAEILKRTLKENDSKLKYEIYDSFYHKLSAVEVFLMKEICEAQFDDALRQAEHDKRSDIYKLTVFLITALIMYRKIQKTVSEVRVKEREGFNNQTLGSDYDEGDVFGFPLEDCTSFTTNPILTASETASCSHHRVENVRMFRSGKL